MCFYGTPDRAQSSPVSRQLKLYLLSDISLAVPVSTDL